jgi:hypothetical protein
MDADPAHEETLSTNEVAARLGIHPSSVSRKRKRGELIAHEVSKGDRTFAWRYPVHLLPPAKPAQGARRPQPADPSAEVGKAWAVAAAAADLAAEARRDRELAAYMLRRVLELEAENRELQSRLGLHTGGARIPWWRRLLDKLPRKPS